MKFAIVGVARNCAKTLRADVERIDRAFRHMGATRWFVVESDSDDGSISELDAMTSLSFEHVSLGRLRDAIPARTERIAYCRNRYLREVRAMDADYVVVVDLDGINNKISSEAVSSCFTRTDWDVCTANQSGPYYDIFALRHPSWSDGDCLAQLRFLRAHGLTERQALFAAVYSKMIVIPPANEWIDVRSAFGGLAIYRKAATDAGQYCGLDGICEHVAFNAGRGLRIKINPRLINAGYTEHTRHMLLLPGLVHEMKLAVKAAIRAVTGDAGLQRLKGA